MHRIIEKDPIYYVAFSNKTENALQNMWRLLADNTLGFCYARRTLIMRGYPKSSDRGLYYLTQIFAQPIPSSVTLGN